MSYFRTETLLDIENIRALEASTSRLPPFLFRAFSVDDSRGINNITEMRPDTARTFPRQSLFSSPRETITSMLRAHLLWEYWNDSNFISWSSSLLWVLEHAARMRNYEQKSNVHVAIMDTRKIHDMALFPTATLMRVYNVPQDDDEKKSKLNPAYTISEYLFYGPLRNASNDPCYRAVHWDSMQNADICGCLSSFWNRSKTDKRLHFRIEAERQRLQRENADPSSILASVVLISALFGCEFQVVMIIAFLSLLCGPSTPSAEELGLKLSYLRLVRPLDTSSIVNFDLGNNIESNLSDVVRFYGTLAEVLEHSLRRQNYQQGLDEAINRLGLDG